MRRFSLSVQHAFRQGRRLLAISTGAGRLSLALGAMLLLGSSLSALATVPNTMPTITSASLSAPSIDEGDTVTLNVTFTDPDVADKHPITIDWDFSAPGHRQQFLLPAGQLSFQATRTYHDNREYPCCPERTITVWVSDEQPGNDNYDGAGDVSVDLKITVKNVAPNINSHALNVTKSGGKSNAVVVQGQYTEPGADPVHVAANWGDGAAGQPKSISACVVNHHTKTFRCEHTYKTGPAKTYQIAIKATDDDGGEDTASTSVQIP